MPSHGIQNSESLEHYPAPSLAKLPFLKNLIAENQVSRHRHHEQVQTHGLLHFPSSLSRSQDRIPKSKHLYQVCFFSNMHKMSTTPISHPRASIKHGARDSTLEEQQPHSRKPGTSYLFSLDEFGLKPDDRARHQGSRLAVSLPDLSSTGVVVVLECRQPVLPRESNRSI